MQLNPTPHGWLGNQSKSTLTTTLNEGKTEEEVKEYIRDNYYEMKPTNEEWFADLGEELNQMDIRRDKIYGEESDVIFDNE